jgi:hypothetical protein
MALSLPILFVGAIPLYAGLSILGYKIFQVRGWVRTSGQVIGLIRVGDDGRQVVARSRSGESAPKRSAAVSTDQPQRVRRALSCPWRFVEEAECCDWPSAQSRSGERRFSAARSVVASAPAVIAGAPVVVASAPAVVAGAPAVVAGAPALVAGAPAVVAGAPALVAGTRSRATLKSASLAERPAGVIESRARKTGGV